MSGAQYASGQGGGHVRRMMSTSVLLVALALLVLPSPVGASNAVADGAEVQGAEAALVAGGFTVHPRGRPVDSTVLVFGCHATAVGATAVSITSCTYKDARAPSLSLPGPVAVTASTAIDFEDEPGLVCWEAHAVSLTGGDRLYSSGCSNGATGITIETG